jgi:CrcB protein
MTVVFVALGAMVGAPLRYLAGHYLDEGFPFGTLIVNVAGSGLLGWLVAMPLTENGLALWGTGFCGALTTYSAFAVQTHDRGPRLGAANVALTLALCLAAAALGYAVAQS